MAKICNPKINTAKFKHKLTLQEITRTSDGQGGYTETWADVVDLWASIAPVKAYERFQAMQLETPITHKLMMRYNANVNTKKRFLFGARVFHIVEVINHEEENLFLTVTCKEMD